MLYRRLLMGLVALAAASVSAISSSARGDAAVTVGPDPASTFSVNVGETLTIPIFGTVTGSSSGIFTYDFDVLVSDPTKLQVLSFLLDGDAELGNPSFISLDAAGAHNLNAGFDTTGMGVGTSAELFRVTVIGLAPGSTTLAIGNSIVPQGAPIVLYDDSEPPVATSNFSVQVNAVPEPASIALLAAFVPLLLMRRSSARA